MLSANPKETPMALATVPGIRKPVPVLGATAAAVMDKFYSLQKQGFRPSIRTCGEHPGTFFLTADLQWARERDAGWTYEPIPRHIQHQHEGWLLAEIRQGYGTVFIRIGSVVREVHRATGLPIPAE